MAVNRMIERGWLQESNANIRRGDLLWRETGDGQGTTPVISDAGLLAIGIEPVTEQTTTAIPNDAAEVPKPRPKAPTPREGTKQALLIRMLRAPTGATMEEIVAATGWQAQSARGAMSGALGKKLGLIVTSAKEADRGRVYRIEQKPVP